MSDQVRPALPQQSHIFFLAILALLLVLIWTVFKPFVIFMVAGVFVAVLALPLDRFIEKRLPNRVAAIFSMTTVFLVLALPVVGLGFALANDAQDLAEAIQEGRVEDWVEEGLSNPLVQDALARLYPDNTTEERNATVFQQVDEFEAQALQWLRGFAADVVQALPGFFIGLTVILFVVYYVLTDGDRLVTYMKRAAPIPAKQVDTILTQAENGVKAVFVGQILTSIIQGALGGIGFLIAGVPGAIVWAAVMAVLSLLPVVGAFLVWVPATLFLFLTGEIWQGVFLAIWGIVVVSQIDNFVRPRLIGNRARIHPLFVLIGVLGGVAAFGFIGLFLGPLIVGVTISVLNVWESEYLHPDVGRDDPSVWEAGNAGPAPMAGPPPPPGDEESE